MKRHLAMVALALALSGCPSKSSEQPGAGGAGPQGSAEAKSKQVVRFGDEKALDESTHLTSSATARFSPPDGDPVATLPDDAPVHKIAQHDRFVLVSFPNPANASETLTGWLPQGVLPGMGGGQGKGGGDGTGAGGGGGGGRGGGHGGGSGGGGGGGGGGGH